MNMTCVYSLTFFEFVTTILQQGLNVEISKVKIQILRVVWVDRVFEGVWHCQVAMKVFLEFENIGDAHLHPLLEVCVSVLNVLKTCTDLQGPTLVIAASNKVYITW